MGEVCLYIRWHSMQRWKWTSVNHTDKTVNERNRHKRMHHTQAHVCKVQTWAQPTHGATRQMSTKREGVTQTCSLCHNHRNVRLTSGTHFSGYFIIHWKCKRDQAGDLNVHLLVQRESKCRFTFINDEQLLLAKRLPVRLKVTENVQSKYSFDSYVL